MKNYFINAIPMDRSRIYHHQYFKFDLTAGLVVFLVAIPLCLGVALASGAPLFSGIIAGIIGGIVVGSISQSSVSVSGPAAGLVAIVLVAIAELGSFEAFLLALLFAGVLQILIGSFRAGFIADYIPSNVVRGLLCAIGVLIIIKQLPLAFTHTQQNQFLMNSLRESSENLEWKTVVAILNHINVGAAVITILSLFVLIGFDKTQNKHLKLIPGSVVVVFLGIILNEIYSSLWPQITQFSAHLVNIPVNNNFKEFLGQFKFPAWDQWRNLNIYWTGLILAVIASLETLLNLEGATRLDPHRRYCSRNRELVAQGFGNMLAGLLGGIPITSVIVRSSVNVQSGAKTKLATIIHGIFILLTVMLIPNWLNAIPLASLAAILIYVGYKLTNPSIYVSMYKLGFDQFIPFVITVIAIVFTNLLMGILIGLFASFFFILKNNSQIRLDIVNEKHAFGDVRRIILPQQISFLRKASLIAELEGLEPGTQLVIDARYTNYIDRDILELVHDFKEREAPDKNISLNLVGFKEKYNVHDHIDFINVTTYDVQSALTPGEVLDLLQEGNQRFINDTRIYRSLIDELKVTAQQFPIAIVLSCIDSRMPVEAIFDVGVGDVLVARVAGNVISDDILASIEFACDVAGAKLIVVLGHTRCGAISAACDTAHAEATLGDHLPGLLKKIEPAVLAEKKTVANRSSSNEKFVLNVTRINVANAMHEIHSRSKVVNRLLGDEKIGLVSAVYDVRSGLVEFDKALQRNNLDF